MNEMLKPKIMLEATRLTRAGRLTDATAILQRMLRGENMHFGAASDVALTGRTPPIIDAKAETIDETDRPLFGAATSARPNSFGGLRAFFDRFRRRSPAPVSTPDIVPAGGRFIEAAYSNPAGTRQYKLYIPSRYQGQALPLIVLLHGCTQSPDDFAAGTRMNLIAEEQTCFVVYPAQPSNANAAKCWNWFRPTDQRRGEGEPSLIAGITRQVMRRFYLRGLVEESMGTETDWKAADSAFVQAASIARDVAKYRHAALSAVRLAGDLNATVTDGLSLDELLVKIKEELRKLGPLIDLEAIREPQGVENRFAGGGERERTGWQKLSAKK